MTSPLCVRDRVDGALDVQFAAIVPAVLVTELQVEIAKRLVRAGIRFIADPQAVLVELDVFLLHSAEDHAAQPPVADRQGLLFPSGGRLVVPQFHLCRVTGRTKRRGQNASAMYREIIRASPLVDDFSDSGRVSL